MDRNWVDISGWLAWWLVNEHLTPENQRVFDRYYSSYKKRFPNYIRKHYVSQTQEITSLISSKKMPHVLEVGCGCGTESIWFAMLGASVIGIDLQVDRLSVARERINILRENLKIEVDVKFEALNLFEMDNFKGFDIIWMEQAFHHIEPRDKVPITLYNLLNPGGYVVIAESNGWNPFLQLSLLRKRGIKTIKQYTDETGKSHLYGDERIITPRSLIKLFKKNNFNFISKRLFRTLPNLNNINRYAWIEKFIPKWFTPAYTHVNIVFQKPQ